MTAGDSRRVVGVGFACVDQLLIWRSVNDPVAGNDVTQYRMQGGGMAATAMVAVTRLGGQAEFWGAAGNGPMGDVLVDELQREQVDTSQVVRVDGCDGPLYLVCVDQATGERMFYRGMSVPDPPNAFGDLARLEGAGCLLVDGTRSVSAIRAARHAVPLGIPVVGDVGYDNPAMDELVSMMDYAIASQLYADRLGMGVDYEAVCRRLLDRGAGTAIVTLGAQGIAVCDGVRYRTKPAFAVDVVDTTGAGDVFHGAFCFGVVRGLTLDANLTFASAVAALACTKLGGRTAIPSLEQVVTFLRDRGADLGERQLERLTL